MVSISFNRLKGLVEQRVLGVQELRRGLGGPGISPRSYPLSSERTGIYLASAIEEGRK